MPDLPVEPGDDCVSNAQLQQMVQRTLSAEKLELLHEHVDDCPRCASELLHLFRLASGSGPADPVDVNAATMNPLDAAQALPLPIFAGALPPGTCIGRFQLREVLGSGNMGTVFTARDPQLGRMVAIKVLRAGRVDARHARRLKREAKAMARVRHPNVITVFEVGEDADVIFIAMEYVAGTTLRVAVAKQPPVAQVLRWLAQVAAGLSAIHAAGMIHRDVKPDNIFVEPTATGDRVVVGDFGLAAHDDEAVVSEQRISSTALGTRGAGTPAYMAPEQLHAASVDARADVFAFGVTAWELLTGKRPFDGRTLAAFDESINRGISGRLKVPGLPDSVARTIERCLSYDASKRPNTMSEVLAAFSTRKQRSRWRVPLLITAAVAVVVPTAVLVSRYQSANSNDSNGISKCDPNAIPQWEINRVNWSERAKELLSPQTQKQVIAAMDARSKEWRSAAEIACKKNIMSRQAFVSCRATGEAREQELLDTALYQRWADDRQLHEVFEQIDFPNECDSKAAAEIAIAMAALPNDETRAIVRRGTARLMRAYVFFALGTMTQANAELARVAVDAKSASPSPLDEELAYAQLEISPPDDSALELTALRNLVTAAAVSGRATVMANAALQLASRATNLHLPNSAIDGALEQADWAILRLDNSPRLRARWLLVAAGAAHANGDIEKSKTYFRNAASFDQQGWFFDRIRLIAIGELATFNGDDREAIRVYREYVDDPAKHELLAPKELADLRVALAEALYRVGDNDDALKEIESVISENSSNTFWAEISPMVNAIKASIVQDLGQNELALSLLKSARAQVVAQLGPTNQFVSAIELRLAYAHLANHNFVEAQNLATSVVDKELRGKGGPTEESVSASSILVDVLVAQQKFEEAGTQCETLIAASRIVFGEKHPMSAQQLPACAAVFDKLGRRSEATDYLEQAVQVFSDIEFDPEITADAQFSLAKMLRTSDPKRAQELATQALSGYQKLDIPTTVLAVNDFLASFKK